MKFITILFLIVIFFIYNKFNSISYHKVDKNDKRILFNDKDKINQKFHKTKFSSEYSNDLNTTESGEAETTGHYNLFTGLSTLDPEIGSIAIFIVVFSVLIVEKIFEKLDEVTKETPFEDMVNTLEKEMMTVGTMAFTFKIIINSNAIHNEHWIFALEFADLLVPITSFCFCFKGIFLVLMSMRQCDMWCRAYRLHLIKLLNRYFNSKYLNIIQRFSWIPFSSYNSEIEFRIFHIIFCDHYHIQRNAFAYDEYVQRIFEKYLLDIITIKPLDWFVVCIIVLINWGKYKLDIKLYCTQSENCNSWTDIKLFFFMGVLMVLSTLVLALLSRIYELRVLASRDILHGEDYIPFLITEENKMDSHLESNRLSGSDLRSAVSDAKSKAISSYQEHISIKDRLLRFIHNLSTNNDEKYESSKVDDNKVHPIELDKDNERTATNTSTKSKKSTRTTYELVQPTIIEQSLRSPSNEKKMISFRRPKSPINNSIRRIQETVAKKRTISEEFNNMELQGSNNKFSRNDLEVLLENDIDNNGSNKKEDDQSDSMNSKQVANAVTTSAKSYVSRIKISNKVINKLTKEELEKTKKRKQNFENGHALELKNIFFFNKPWIYFYATQTQAMIISFYIALWFCNFLISAEKTLDSPLWVVLSLLPGLISFVLYVYVVKCGALLKALIFLDHDTVEEIIEQTETSHQLAQTMKDKMISRLKDMGDPEVELFNLYHLMDNSGHNTLRRSELQLFVEAMGITFSRKRWRQMFRQIDSDNDDSISFEELVLFVFPEHNAAIAEERMRLKAMENNVNLRMSKIKSRFPGRQMAKLHKSILSPSASNKMNNHVDLDSYSSYK